MNLRRLPFAALDRLRTVPGSTWVGTVAGVAVGWTAVSLLKDAPMDPPVAVGFALCVVVMVMFILTFGVVLVHIAEHDERLVWLETRGEMVPEVEVAEAAEAAEVDEPAPSYYERIKAEFMAADARMQPTFLEPEPPFSDVAAGVIERHKGLLDRLAEVDGPVAEPEPVRRPSPVPREPETVPMTRAWEESAAELSDEEWQAKQDAEWAALRADIAEMAKGVGSGSDR